MVFNYSTKRYLQEMKAVLVSSQYKVVTIDYYNLKAYVNKVDVYKKRNGKLCKVQHHFGRWVQFPKEMIGYAKSTRTGVTDDWCVGDREEYTYEQTTRYLTAESKKQIVELYHKNK